MTSLQSLHFISRYEAAAMEPSPNNVIISINGTDEYPANLKDGWGDKLHLEFDDIHYSSTESLVAFDIAMADQIIDFAMKHKDTAKRLYVHCHAGISRSAAVAMVLGKFLDLPVYSKNTPLSDRYNLHNKKVEMLLTMRLLRREEENG